LLIDELSKNYCDDTVIRDIWIVEKAGGRCLFHRTYGPMGLDPDLLSSYLTGINTFSEAELGDTGIECIEMGNMKWVYINWENKLLLVAAADKFEDPTVLHHQLDVVCQHFLDHFKIDRDFLSKWSGNVTMFSKFGPNIDELINDWKQVSKVTDIAKKMNLLEVYQQIFHAFAKVVPTIRPEGRKELAERMAELKTSFPPYFEKVTYGNAGWDILSADVTDPRCKEYKLREELQNLLNAFVSEMKSIFKEELFFEIAKKLVYPKLLSDWSRIRELEIDEALLQIFLI